MRVLKKCVNISLLFFGKNISDASSKRESLIDVADFFDFFFINDTDRFFHGGSEVFVLEDIVYIIRICESISKVFLLVE